LKSPDRCFTFIEGDRKKWAYYNKQYGGLVITDETTGQLLTMYMVDIQEHLRKRKYYLEIK
jgi:hypothetical protein